MKRSFAKILKDLREKENLSQVDLANIFKLSRSTISMYEQGKRTPDMEILEQIADYFNVDMDYLYGKTDVKNRYQENYALKISNLMPVKKKTLPLLGSVACGEPIWAEQDWEGNIATDVDVDADFCLLAQGDSMINARIYDGDVVFIKQQSIVENGQIGVVLIDNEATLKRVYYDQASNVIQLVAENPAYPPLVYSNSDLETIRILGKAVAFQSKLS